MTQRPHSKAVIEAEAHKYGFHDSDLDQFLRKIAKAPKTCNVAQLCKDLTLQLGAQMFNPMLRLRGQWIFARAWGFWIFMDFHFESVFTGFNGHQETPVKTLHMVLLGIVKYLYQDTVNSFGISKPGSKGYHKLLARWCAFNTKGLIMFQEGTTIQLYIYCESLYSFLSTITGDLALISDRRGKHRRLHPHTNHQSLALASQWPCDQTHPADLVCWQYVRKCIQILEQEHEYIFHTCWPPSRYDKQGV